MNNIASALANIAAQAAQHVSPSLIMPGDTAAETAVQFAWWSVNFPGDATEEGGDFWPHFRTWETERLHDTGYCGGINRCPYCQEQEQ